LGPRRSVRRHDVSYCENWVPLARGTDGAARVRVFTAAVDSAFGTAAATLSAADLQEAVARLADAWRDPVARGST
jgi:hypothetical protein